MAKWLEPRSHTLEVWRSNPRGNTGFFLFFYQWQSVLNQVPQERSILAVFFSIITLTVLSEMKQADHTQNEDFSNIKVTVLRKKLWLSIPAA